MTLAFWVLAANLIIIALLIVVVPIWFRRDVDIEDNQQHNLDIGRQKLVDLKNQREQQKINQAEYEDQLTELELALDNELSPVQVSKTTANQGRWIVAIIIPLLPIAAITLYLTLGTPQMLNAPQAQDAQHTEATSTSTTTQADIKTMLVKLVERLRQNPDDVKGWLMLGRTYMYLNSYSDAADAFDKANQLQPDDVNVIIQYADALAMSSGGRMQGKPSEMVFKALAMDPEHTTGLWLAGMAKAEQGDYQAALAYWLKLEPLIASDAESTIRLQKLIVDARAKIGQQTPVIKPEQTQSAVAQLTDPALTIRVELSADLQSQAAPTDTVFIYAQALQGMRIPLAIVRKQVKDLPTTITLTDAQSMSPMAKLSGNEQVKILARISKAGSAMPQSGDLLGTVAPVQVAETEIIQVVISQVLKGTQQ